MTTWKPEARAEGNPVDRRRSSRFPSAYASGFLDSGRVQRNINTYAEMITWKPEA